MIIHRFNSPFIDAAYHCLIYALLFMCLQFIRILRANYSVYITVYTLSNRSDFRRYLIK